LAQKVKKVKVWRGMFSTKRLEMLAKALEQQAAAGSAVVKGPAYKQARK